MRRSSPAQCSEFCSCPSAHLMSNPPPPNSSEPSCTSSIKATLNTLRLCFCYLSYFLYLYQNLTTSGLSNIWKSTHTLKLSSNRLLVSVCWWNASSSCLPVIRKWKSRYCEQDYACLGVVGQIQCAVIFYAVCVCRSLSRVFKLSTSLCRFSNSSRQSLETKLSNKKQIRWHHCPHSWH